MAKKTIATAPDTGLDYETHIFGDKSELWAIDHNRTSDTTWVIAEFPTRDGATEAFYQVMWALDYAATQLV